MFARFCRQSCRAFVLASLVVAAGCASPADLEQLEFQDVSTGFYDAGIKDGMNYLKPSISFKLRNTGDDDVSSVQLNVMFHREGDDGPWGESLIRAIDSSGLPAGQSTTALIVRPDVGYTGLQPRAEMLSNSSFVDVTVKVFAKSGSAQWNQLGEFKIERRLIVD